MSTISVVLAACALLSMGCDSDSPTSSAQNTLVRPLEEVSASGPPVITDITASSATLRFESSVPLVCAVIYGETTDYGLIATDDDMLGGAHSDHSPFMPELEPDTEYDYRVQGTAADGTLYVSEDMAFRTPVADAGPEVNVLSAAAGARIVAVSSNFGGAADDERWGAGSAIDDSPGTAWSSAGDGDGAFIEIALAAPARLHAIEVWTRSMTNNTAQIFSFTLTTDAGETLGPFELEDASQAYRFEVDVVASSLRFEVVSSNGGNTGLVEFAAYGIFESE
jgi:hypothetical protein